MIRRGRRYAARTVTRPVTGLLVLLGVLVMHGLGVGHGMHLPGQVDAAPTGSTSSHPAGHVGAVDSTQDAEMPGMTHESLLGTAASIGHDATMPAAAVAAVVVVASAAAVLTSTDDMAGHSGALCTAVLPVLVGLLMLLLALAALRRPGYRPPVPATRRVRARGSPPTRHTTSILQLCVSRT